MLIDSRSHWLQSVIAPLLPVEVTIFRGRRILPSHWDWTVRLAIETVYFECQDPYFFYCASSSRTYTLFTLGLSSLASNHFVSSFPSFLSTYFTHQTYVMEHPSIFFLLSFLPSSKLRGNTVSRSCWPCIISPIYPMMTNLPITVRGYATLPHEREIIVRFSAASKTLGNLSPGFN